MDSFTAGLRSLAQESSSRGGGGASSSDGAPLASGRSQMLIRAPPGRVVTLGTCSKLCLLSFSIGVLVGFTLKRRLRRWAAKLLRRLKED
ncbi:unnamed protein product [Spirodela intermedia]|uniref:Uncharacterized protein n=1 Tax=Spirodela intermedia TaxID=51605 RepID=A0A7I8J1V8_SPIIN|nr:unnamed protein product [Spirodela intermedia]CAA6664206.1 unnamed protein product [Spirodela intermedia]